jgi:transcriptional regulator with XRE-family HTH domain
MNSTDGMCLSEHNGATGVERRWVVRTGSDLGRGIGEIRRAQKLTQEQLAEQTGLARPWLAKLETGRSATVLDQLLRVLRILGATVTITFDDPAPDQPTLLDSVPVVADEVHGG